MTNGPLNFDVFYLLHTVLVYVRMYIRTYKEVVCIHKYAHVDYIHTYM